MNTQVVIPTESNNKSLMKIDDLRHKIFSALLEQCGIEEFKIKIFRDEREIDEREIIRSGTLKGAVIVTDHFPNRLFLSTFSGLNLMNLCSKDDLQLTFKHKYYAFPPGINLNYVKNVISSVLLDVYQNTYAHKNETSGLYIDVMHNSLLIAICHHPNPLSRTELPGRTQIIKFQHTLSLMNAYPGQSILYLLQKKEEI